MSIWKQFLVLALLAALAYGGYEGYRRYLAPEEAPAGQSGRRGAGPAVVELATAEMRTLSETIEAVGTTRARQSIDIVPEASGRIEEIAFAPGQHVEAGAILVRLDDTIARADVAEADAKLIERERVLERVTQLRGTNAVAEATLEEAIARLAEARAQLDRAEQRLAERIIRAPFDGTVGLAEIDQGARVSAGTFITRLDDLSDVEVEFSLPETLFARVKTGQKITATSAAFPGRTFDGQIEAVDSRIDPVSRSFRTRAIIPNPDGTLPAGMFMSLELTLSQTDRIVVPEEAIVFQAAETYVFRVAEEKARRVSVETGQRRAGLVAILDGLDEGDHVVVRGLHRVRDGGAIEILNTPGASATATENGS
ncbi:efflux RND transporter periplasmic adaptor subunit [Marimonas arenosa]|uniref:Efflux RND transporter periplasmic adaptor subunit n=1 Tax=Marimonas arenosa TaxID=1795305 RepID=A0AAE4B4R9_9RHOB|nr:efflux RND transporter periplasmic adaptor subunit [Marimonas arenosa]MDQ2091338.1 efflux RND transporter periplasmic adaptor subunit [Marimonas arenosa]